MMDFFIELPTSNINDLHKAKISEVIADTDFKMIQGGDEELNLLQTLSMIALIINSWVLAEPTEPAKITNNFWKRES